MKSFKKMVSEVAQPAKSKEEKAFKDMHSYETKSHPVAPDAVFTGDIGKPKASRKADQEGDINYDKQFKRESFDIAENVKASIAKSLSKSGESSKEGKKAVTLKKAPWEKNEATMTEQTCSCCDSNIDEDGKCACGSDCPECGGQHEVSEAGCGSSKKRNEEIEVQEAGGHSSWNVTFKHPDHKPVTVKGRNTAEAIKKAEKKATAAAGKKHLATYKNITKESVEELDELSKKTLGSYVKKASKSASDNARTMRDSETDHHTYRATADKYVKRIKGISKANDKLTKESFDLSDFTLEELEDFMMSEDFAQLDELSKKTLTSYLKKAEKQATKAGDSYSNAAFRRHDFAPDTPAMAKNAKKLAKRIPGIDRAHDRLAKESVELDEIGDTPAGKKKLKNLIVNRTQKAVDAGASLERRPEKAAQYDKAQKRHMKTIGRAAERLAKEEVELDEISQAKKDDYIKKSSADRQGAWSKKNIADRLRDKKTSAAMKIKMAKRDKGMSRAMGEELSPAQKKIDHNKNGRIDGKDLAALRAKKKNESVELDESVKTGSMKLKDGKTINVSKQDAMLLNQMMKDLNPKNRKEMQKVMMTDKAGFDEIVGFAREAL